MSKKHDEDLASRQARIGLSSNAVIRHNAEQLRFSKSAWRFAESKLLTAKQDYVRGLTAGLTIPMLQQQAEMAAVQYRRALIAFIGKP